MQPLISILLPTYNSEATLGRALESIKKQIFDSYEVIIIDGLSSDETLRIASTYQEFFKERLKIVSEKDNGIFDAMGKGVRMAQGELIVRIGSDDWFEEDAFSVISTIHDPKAPALLYGIERRVKPDGTPIKLLCHDHSLLLHGLMIPDNAAFVPKKFFNTITFDPSYKLGADFDLMLRFLKAGFAFKQVPRVIINFTTMGDSSRNWLKAEREVIRSLYANGVISNKAKLVLLLKHFIKRIAYFVSQSSWYTGEDTWV